MRISKLEELLDKAAVAFENVFKTRVRAWCKDCSLQDKRSFQCSLKEIVIMDGVCQDKRLKSNSLDPVKDI